MEKISRPAILKEFESLSLDDDRALSSLLPGDRVPVGFFCSYVPEELIYAAGGHPFRLMGGSLRISRALAHLPSYCCYLVKSSLESLLQGSLQFLKGIVFAHSCDSMKGLSEIWALQKTFPIHFNLMVPSHLDSDRSRIFLRAEIERFKEYLSSHLGTITAQNLKSSVHLFNQIRQSLGRLYDLRLRQDASLSAKEFAQIIRLGYRMDRPRYLDLLKELIEALEGKANPRKERVPLYVVGNMVPSESWFSLVEDAGAFIVGDDLCSGARTLRLSAREDLDPIEAMTERYFSSYLCPTKYKGVDARLDTLLKDVEESGARGVIFLLYKYCEAHFFDYPDLRSAFESKGLPTLLIEVEDPSSSVGQMKVRIQAFVEMLTPL